jgi:hypothetical protein
MNALLGVAYRSSSSLSLRRFAATASRIRGMATRPSRRPGPRSSSSTELVTRVSLGNGVQGIGEAGWERPELALDLQVAGRVVGADLKALFASARNRADLLVDRPHADGTLGDLVSLADGVVPGGDVLEVGEDQIRPRWIS